MLAGRDAKGLTPLMLAVDSGNAEQVKWLLFCGAPVDAVSDQNETALYMAAKQDQRNATKVLLAHGADPNIASKNGLTPLMAAIQCNRCAVIKFLLKAGANLDTTAVEGKSLLQLAMSTQGQLHHKKVLQLLRSHPRTAHIFKASSQASVPSSGTAASQQRLGPCQMPSRSSNRDYVNVRRNPAGQLVIITPTNQAGIVTTHTDVAQPLAGLAPAFHAKNVSGTMPRTYATRAVAAPVAQSSVPSSPAEQLALPSQSPIASSTTAQRQSPDFGTAQAISSAQLDLPSVCGSYHGRTPNSQPNRSADVKSAADAALKPYGHSIKPPIACRRTLALEPHEAALFTHPMMSAKGQQLISEVQAAHGVQCFVPAHGVADSGSAGDITCNGVKIQICQGDLQSQAVDVIACSSDKRVAHLRPQQQASSAQPASLMDMLASWIWTSIWTGATASSTDAAPSKPSNRPCHFIHAVGPSYSGQLSVKIALMPFTTSIALKSPTKQVRLPQGKLKMLVLSQSKKANRKLSTVLNSDCRLSPKSTRQTWLEASLHAVGGDSQSIQALQEAMMKVLHQSATRQAATLAMPLIGAGQAQWPCGLAAQVQIAAVLKYARQGIPCSLKEIRLVDMNAAAVTALRAQLSAQAMTRVLVLTGSQTQCDKAVRQIQAVVKAHITSTDVALSPTLSVQSRQEMLAAAPLNAVSAHLTNKHTLHLTGCEELVCRAENHVFRCLNQAMHQTGSGYQYPDTWQPFSSAAKTELFEVNSGSQEVAQLVCAAQRAGAVVVKVHRIQNPRLWRAFCHSKACMKERWSHDPHLQLVNGGSLTTLWHGTSRTEPHKIFASELGFTQNFASLSGAWGVGTYYSTKAQLAMHFSHHVKLDDPSFGSHLKGVAPACRHNLKQVLAVDVLTGKSKHLGPDRALRMPPILGNPALAEQLGIPDLRYDSVSGTYNGCQTPIYVTYNSAHAYPKYLITYR